MDGILTKRVTIRQRRTEKHAHMNKRLLHVIFFGVICCTTLRAQSTTYHPMLADTNIWSVYMDVMPILLQPQSNTTLSQPPSVQQFGPGNISTVKDTVVGSKTYTMFYSRSNEDYPALWSLLREDTATQQVFLLSAGDTTERITYDFSLNTGDSIWLDFSYQQSNTLQSGWWYVDSTSTYMITAGPRKALYLSNPNNPLHNGNQIRFIQWIESVGCNISPLYLDETTTESLSQCEQFMGPGCSFNAHLYSVTCASQNGIQTFSSECWENVRNVMQFAYPFGDTCLFILMGAVHDAELGIKEVKLIPNPASGNTQLLFEGETSNEFSITITNVLGEIVGEVPLTWYAKGQHTVQLSLSGYAPGIYSVNLIGESGRISVKMVVQ